MRSSLTTRLGRKWAPSGNTYIEIQKEELLHYKFLYLNEITFTVNQFILESD